MIPTVEWKNGIVRMLDQTKLPLETVYNDCKDYQTVAQGIKELWVRGAPAIGVSAAMGLALGRAADHGRFLRRVLAEVRRDLRVHGGHPSDGGEPLLGHRADQKVRAGEQGQGP